jgi:hypothetical protein
LIFLTGFESPHRILTGGSHEDPHKIWESTQDLIILTGLEDPHRTW